MSENHLRKKPTYINNTIMAHPLRIYAVEKFIKSIDKPYALNIEKSIFNWAIHRSHKNCESPTWENTFFKE